MSKRPTGTREWASSSANIMVGCEHGCLYCYAKTACVRRGAVYAENWTDPTVNPKPKMPGKREGTIMFPTEHDITPGNADITIPFAVNLLKAGNRVLVVSKPRKSVVLRMVEEFEPYHNNVMFRFTIGSANDDTLAFWEPGAPTFDERYRSLMLAFMAGYETSVSMEPMLDTELKDILGLVNELSRTVSDSIWLGKANKLVERLAENGYTDPKYLDAARTLMESQSDERIFALYDALKLNPLVKWKDSIKRVVGLETPAEVGMDI